MAIAYWNETMNLNINEKVERMEVKDWLSKYSKHTEKSSLGSRKNHNGSTPV